MNRARSSERTSPFLLRGSLAVETVAALPLFLFAMITVFSMLMLPAERSTHLLAVCEEAKEAGILETAREETQASRTWTWKPVQFLAAFPGITYRNEIRVHSWSGRADSFGAGETGEKLVYVTQSGTAYHTDLNCTYLHLSVREVSGTEAGQMRNRYGEAYHACGTCSRGQAPSGSVYITETGNRYHNDGTCSSLKRSVHLVTEKEAGDMHLCSRCASAS